jgi:hypothetical protein
LGGHVRRYEFVGHSVSIQAFRRIALVGVVRNKKELVIFVFGNKTETGAFASSSVKKINI